MKNKASTPHDVLKKWMVETGTETLGDEFHLSVLKKIEALPQPKTYYSPVISSGAWTVIIGLIASLLGWSVFSAPSRPGNSSIVELLKRINLPKPSLDFLNLSISTPDLGSPFQLGILAFFILGFLMVLTSVRSRQSSI